jgi:hypothetical protein
VDEVFQALQTTPVAQYLRTARWGYAALNTAHVFGIALLVGAILPLDLRLLGFWPRIPRADLARILVPVSVVGLVIAAVTGPLLFTIRADEYAVLGVFQAKLVFIVLGIAGALTLHRAYGLALEGASERRVATHAAVSIVCWIGALVCGRMIAFVME